MRLVAIDLGSNSFRLEAGQVIGRQIVVESCVKEHVRLASGLDDDNCLSQEIQEKAFLTLARFREKIRGIPKENIRVVGTQTFRIAKNIDSFLKTAEKILDHKIDILSGTEEARITYCGCAHTVPEDFDNRLVIDIGGASTEIVLGHRFQVLRANSVAVGCITVSSRFFPDGVLSQDRFLQARTWAYEQFQCARSLFKDDRWDHIYGSAGTVSAVANIGQAMALGDGCVTPTLLLKIAERLLQMRDFSQIRLPGLKENRREVIVGGLAAMLGLFEAFHIEKMKVAKGAVRYGLLYELLEGKPVSDLKEETIDRLLERFPTDREETARVVRRSQIFFNAITGNDSNADFPPCLRWAAIIRKIGQRINFSEYSRHSHYIFTHTDLNAFTKEEREKIALLLLAQSGDLGRWIESLADPEIHAMTLSLRLAGLFSARLATFDFENLTVSRTNHAVTLKIPSQWLCASAWPKDNLEREKAHWEKIGYRFLLETQ